MVLLGFEEVTDAARALEALGDDPGLSRRRHALLQEPRLTVVPVSGAVHVHVVAEEMAFVDTANHKEIDLLASDDATTCSVVILTRGSIIAVAHLDSAGQMNFFLEKWEEVASGSDQIGSSPTRVAIAGGYEDERSISRPISLSILEALMCSRAVYDVQQFITAKWNLQQTENGAALPLVRGIGYFPAEDAFRHVEFDSEARNVAVPLRFAGVPSYPLHLVLECVDANSELTIVVGSYRGTFVSPEISRFLLTLSDDQLLHKISTSPLAEGPKFLQDMKDALKFICSDSVALVREKMVSKLCTQE